MSFLWYWPADKTGAGGWDFDAWKAKPASGGWKPLSSEQSGTHELLPPIQDGATELQWTNKAEQWRKITAELMGTLTDAPPKKPAWEMLGEAMAVKGQSPYSLRRIRYKLTEEEWGYAWIAVPENRKQREGSPARVVIALHQTTPSGKDEVMGLERVPERDNGVWYGQELAERGFVVFAPDAIAFGERQSGHPNTMYRSADQFFEKHPQGSVMGKMAYDVSRAIDVLSAMEQVDERGVGCIGHSHGAYGTLFAMLADERIKAGVISCGVDLLRDDSAPDRWWRKTALIPRLGMYEGRMEQTPIDFHIWLAMLAPRSVLVVNATDDKIFPNTRKLPEAMELSRRAYRAMGNEGGLRGYHFPGDHSFPKEARDVAYRILSTALGGQ